MDDYKVIYRVLYDAGLNIARVRRMAPVRSRRRRRPPGSGEAGVHVPTS